MAGGGLQAQTLLNLLYLSTGWRAIGTPAAEIRQPQIVRLAVPSCYPQRFEHMLVHVAAIARKWPSGLTAAGTAETPYAAIHQPIDFSAWEAGIAKFHGESSILESSSIIAGDRLRMVVAGRRVRNALRRRLCLTDDWFVVITPRQRGPQRVLSEACARLGARLETGDPLLSRLDRYWRSADPAEWLNQKGDDSGPDIVGLPSEDVFPTVVRAGSLRSLWEDVGSRRPGEVVVTDLGSLATWVVYEKAGCGSSRINLC